MTVNPAVQAAHDHYSKEVRIHPRSQGEPLIKAADAITAFIAGADWQKEQLTRLVPRLGPGVVIGVDLAGPGSDYTASYVTVTIEDFTSMNSKIDRLTKAVNHEREQVGKLESQIGKLTDERDKMTSSVFLMTHERDEARNAEAEARIRAGKANQQANILRDDRDAWEKTAITYAEELHMVRRESDDWHLAYDKLVSDIVHGRPFTFGLKPDPVDLQQMQDAATFGLGWVSVDEKGNRRNVDPREFYSSAWTGRDPNSDLDPGAGYVSIKPEAPIEEKRKPSVLERLAHLEQYVFGD